MSFRKKTSVRRQVVAESFLYTDLQIGTKKLRIQFFFCLRHFATALIWETSDRNWVTTQFDAELI